MKWKTLLLRTMAVFVIFFIAGCDSGNGDDPKTDCGPSYCISDLAGTWNATELTFSACSGEGFFDLIAEGGSASLVIQTNGRFTLTVTFPDGSETFTGRMYFEDSTFFAIQFDEDPPDDPTYFGDTLSGNTFRLNGGPETAEFDFNDDGNDECASVDLTVVKS
ncbi:hypothetical protein [Muriicola marianensis]|nr:hypothetical protein [Muriicola marianensis]